MRPAKLIIANIHYKLLIVGLLLIIAANLFDVSVLKIDIDEGMANLGVLFFLIGGIQWLFDVSVRQQLYEEITELTVKNINVVTSGIVDVLDNSKNVDYSEPIRQSSMLTIGLNYTPRILEDYFEEFKARALDGLSSTIVALNIKSGAGDLLSLNKEESGHMQPNLDKLKKIVGELNGIGPGKMKILYHAKVLHYSFVRFDSCLWVKPYRNSNGRSRVPAIQVKVGTNLYDYFSSDIDMFIDQASER